MMRLSEYAERHYIGYRAAWNRFKQGKIPGAFKDEVTGQILIPDEQDELMQRAVVYARVSTTGQKDDLERQADRLVQFATVRGLEVVSVVKEVGSGVNENRKKLNALLAKNDQWGVLVVEHRDRLARVGFGYIETLLSLMTKSVLVVETYEDSDEGRMNDVFSILHSFAASEYGKRGAKNRAERAQKALE